MFHFKLEPFSKQVQSLTDNYVDKCRIDFKSIKQTKEKIRNKNRLREIVTKTKHYRKHQKFKERDDDTAVRNDLTRPRPRTNKSLQFCFSHLNIISH